VSYLLRKLESSECKAECAKHEPARIKQGSAADRAACAAFAREQRANFPGAHWSRADWNHYVFITTRNRLSRLTASRKTLRVVGFSRPDERRSMEMQVERNRRDPLLQNLY
jgi:hypothetical protein